MAEHSITQLLSLINRQLDSQETLNTYLSKAEAVMQVAMSDDFLSYPRATTYYYLWAVSDIVEQAKKLNEESLGLLLKNVSLH